MKNFILMGAGGYIAPRHLEAIKDSGNNLLAAYDPNDSVGILDRFFPKCQFFNDLKKLELFLTSTQQKKTSIDYFSICSPNYLHFEQIQMALKYKANVICEKPLVLHEKDLDELQLLEKQSGKKVNVVLQLRVHPAIIDLKKRIEAENKNDYKVELDYVSLRGPWYHESWKGNVKKSGGLSTNIGVHFFDMLTWIFGKSEKVVLYKKAAEAEEGYLHLNKAQVNWKLAISEEYLPAAVAKQGKTTFRSIKIDGVEFEFSEGFADLHKAVYKNILQGDGYGLQDARAGIAIVEKLREISL